MMQIIMQIIHKVVNNEAKCIININDKNNYDDINNDI